MPVAFLKVMLLVGLEAELTSDENSGAVTMRTCPAGIFLKASSMLDWKDGQPFSDRFGDVYFSTDSGLEETRHVFLRGNDLARRFAALQAGESFCIGETGFGTGLNFLCVWQLFEQTAPAGASLDFFSVEKFPLSDDDLGAALALWPELFEGTEALLGRWKRRVPGWNRWCFANGRVRLTLVIEDVATALPQLPAGCVDAWFLDGFSPSKNPEMWHDEVMANIARISREGASLATYTSAGWVRRGLQQAGFAVEKVAGFGRKREMVQGRLVIGMRSPTPALPRREKGQIRCSKTSSPPCFPLPSGEGLRVGEHSLQTVSRNEPPRSAIVIGGGIAGCAAAHALAQRGISVTLVERAPQLASAASGNPRGILHARFGAGGDLLHRFVLAAYGHVLGLLDEVMPVDGVSRAECGLLQLACKAVEVKRLSRLAAQDWPAHLMQFVDAEQASQLAGVEMRYDAAWFPAGGWVVPPKLCAALARHPSIESRFGHEVECLERPGAIWRASGHDAQGGTWHAEADVVLVCCAHSARKLAQFEHFPLIPVRGQITLAQATEASRALQSVVCGDGYCAPAVGGAHVMGATHAFDDESTEVHELDHAENLSKLAEYAPALRHALDQDAGGAHRAQAGMIEDNQGGQQAAHPALIGGRASIRCSAPGSMPLVGEVEQGLYCSLAHGTRGLLTAGIAGEVLASKICGQLPPLPTSILDVLSPSGRVGTPCPRV